MISKLCMNPCLLKETMNDEKEVAKMQNICMLKRVVNAVAK